MEQIQYTPYDSSQSYKPVATPNLLPEIEREAQRQSQADAAALQQLQENNRQRVQNSKLAGQDLIQLSKFSKTIATEVGKIYKRNEDEKAVNEVYESIVGGVVSSSYEITLEAELEFPAVSVKTPETTSILITPSPFEINVAVYSVFDN